MPLYLARTDLNATVLLSVKRSDRFGTRNGMDRSTKHMNLDSMNIMNIDNMT